MKKRYIAATVAFGVGLVMIPGASAQITPTSYSNTVGIMVDSINGNTNADINCFTEGSNGKFKTGPDGDATLFMVNRQPHTIICVINIKKN